MATRTTNLDLVLPDGTDYVSRSTINNNNTKIDTAIGAIPNGQTVQGQINTVNGKIGNTSLPTTAQTLTGAIAEHETDLGGKTDKVTGGTENNFAGLDANGNLKDSGKKASDFVATSEKGAASGVATLDSNGKIPTSQLPSMANDVIEGYYYNSKFYEEAAHTTEITGETGKAYLDLGANHSYRYNGTAFVRMDDPTDIIDDTAGDGDTGKVWSADKTYDEVNATKSTIDAIKNEKANASISPIINNTVDETIKTVENCAEDMGIGMVIPIAPVQDLHGYANPWPGGGGKNMLQLASSYEERYGITYAPNPATGEITIDGTAESFAQVTLCNIDLTNVPTGTTLYINGMSNNSDCNTTIEYLDGGSIAIRSIPDTGDYMIVPEGTTYVKVKVGIMQGVTVNNAVMKPFVAKSETALPFEPYANICPISGFTGVDITRTGKNLFDGLFTTGKLISDTGAENNNNDHKISTNYIPVKALAHYTISGTDIHKRPSGSSSSSNTFVNVARYRADKSFIDRAFSSQSSDLSYDFETTEETSFIRFTVGVESSNVQIEVGKIASNYTPYTGCNEYNITFPTEAGTVYGGTVTINEDGSGTLVVDSGYITVGDLTFTYDSTYTRFSTSISGIKRFSGARRTPFVCSGFISIDDRRAIADVPDNAIYAAGTSDNVYIKNTTYTDATSFTNAYADVQIVYPLASIVEYSLTQQQITSLFGTNTLWNSIGTFSMSYHLDPKVYVDDMAGIKGSVAKSDSTVVSIKTLTDGADNLPMGVGIAIMPVQDLHGQDYPYPPGGGKNLLPCLLSSVKTKNTSGTWSGDKYTYRGVTFSCESQDGYITKVTCTGTATSGDSTIRIYQDDDGIPVGNYIVNGCPSGGSTSTYYLRTYNVNATSGGTGMIDDGSGVSIDSTYPIKRVNIYVKDGTALPTAGVVFYPMVRLSTDTDATFAPYSNICPITGWTGAKIARTGKNLWNEEYEDVGSTLTYVQLYVGNGSFTLSTTTPVRGTSTANVFLVQGKIDGTDGIGITSSVNGAYLGKTVTMQSVDGYVTFVYRRNEKDPNDYKTQIERGSTATSYEPFGTTYSITFPHSAGTVYGGTLTVNKDGTGMLTVDRACYTIDGTETYIDVTSSNAFYLAKDGLALIEKSTEADKCSMFPVVSATGGVDMGNNTVSKVQGSTQARLYVKSSMFAGYTASQLATYFASNNMQFCGKLINTVHYSLTTHQVRSLLGINNIWADTGNVLAVDYYADTKTYIDNKFAELQALILENI